MAASRTCVFKGASTCVIKQPPAAGTDWQHSAGGFRIDVLSPTRGVSRRGLTQRKLSPGFPGRFSFAIVRAVVKIEGDFDRAAPSHLLRPVGGKAVIDRALQFRQLLNYKLLPEIAANGLGIRSAGQFSAERFGRSTIRRGSAQYVIDRFAPHAIPVGFQRQAYSQGLFRLAQDYFIVEFRLIITWLVPPFL